MNKETEIQKEVQYALASRPDVRVWRNTVGTAWMGPCVNIGGKMYIKPVRKIVFGLCPGSADLIGFKSVTITKDMVGKKAAVFLGVEVKQPGEKAKNIQDDWLKMVREFGGIGVVAYNKEVEI